MSCLPFNIKDYFFGELPTQDRRTVDLHLASCPNCQEELDALNLTQNALLMVRDEEPPSRIAFVSDKVFEPRWYQSLWNSAPKMAFASSAILAAAILVHGLELNRPVAVVSKPSQSSITEAEVATRVEAAVQKAVAESEARQTVKLQQVVGQQRKMESDYKAQMLQVEDSYRMLRRSIAPRDLAAANFTRGEGQ
ncbi:MAG: zf-HC2 domain-containing protein [Bryobacteraceae bacterium]